MRSGGAGLSAFDEKEQPLAGMTPAYFPRAAETMSPMPKSTANPKKKTERKR